MYCSQCVCFRVCPDKHPHGTVLFSTRSGDAFSPGQSHMCPLLQGVHLHQCFHGWLWCKKHKGSTKAPQTISCFIWVRFLKHRALCLNRFGCKALLLLYPFIFCLSLSLDICTLEHHIAGWKEKRFDFFCAFGKTTLQHIVPGMYLF